MVLRDNYQERLVEAVMRVGTHLKYLGTGDAGTTMGAIEYLAKETKEASERIAEGLHAIAEAIQYTKED